jgi:hypothetical protein
MKISDYIAPLSLVVFCALSASAPAQTVAESQRAEVLRDRLKLVNLQRQRWEHLIATHEALTRNPDQLSRLAKDAADDMSDAGREMMVEGVSDGLGGVLSLEAAYAHRVEPIARHFKEEAAAVDFTYQLFVKDRVRNKRNGDPKPEDLIDKVNATIGLGLERIPDPEVRAMVSAMMPLSKGTAGFLGAYLRGDQQKMDENFDSTKSLLEGTLTMLGTLSQNPAALQGVAGTIARKYPAFGATAGFMSSTALTDFNIALAISKLGFGAYGMWSGYELDNQAEAIREKQQIAARLLQNLLPRARQEILRAQEEESSLQAELDVIEKRLRPPTSVLPSQRFIDDGVAVPVRWTNLPVTLDAIRELPAVSSGMTEEEARLQRQAARKAEERRKATEAEARREAERQSSYAEERHSYYVSRGNSSGGNTGRGSSTSSSNGEPATTSSITTDPNSCFVRHCLGGGMKNFDAVNAVNKVIDGLNRQGSSTLGNIEHVK